MGAISLPQMLARTALVFLIGLAMLRLSSPRMFSRATPIDIVVSVIIGSNLSRALTGNAPFFNVVVSTAFLVIVYGVVTRLATRWRPLATLLKGRARTLVSDGILDKEAMRGAAVGMRDLMAAVRAAGGQSIGEVWSATLERGGEIDVRLTTDGETKRERDV